MHDVILTEHALRRSQQRALRSTDREIIFEVGSWITADTICILEKGVHEEQARIKQKLAKGTSRYREKSLKQRLQRVGRLKNAELVMDGSVLITCVRPNRKRMARQLRRSPW